MAEKKAQILIRIRGGIKAAAEADTVAEAIDQLGDDTDQLARAAARATFALKWMRRGIGQVGRTSVLASAGVGTLTVASLGLKLVALSLASVALPALALSLYNVALAAGVLTVAFGAGLMALFAGVGLMTAGVIGRFQLMRDVVGSAANDLLVQANSLKSAFMDATSLGADRVMRGLADALGLLTPLVRSLAPSFDAMGLALGRMLRTVGRDLAGMGPQLTAMFAELVPVIESVGVLLPDLLGLFIQLGTVGAPLVADAFRTLAGWARDWTGAITGGTIERAKSTLRGFADGIRAFFSGIAEPLKGIFGPAMDAWGASFARMARPAGQVIGTILAGFLTIAQVALPVVAAGVSALATLFTTHVAPALKGLDVAGLGADVLGVFTVIAGAAAVAIPAIIRFGKRLFLAIAPAAPLIENVIWPLIKGIGQGVVGAITAAIPIIGAIATALGWIGEKARPLRGVFETVGKVIGFVFTGPIIGAVGKVLAGIGKFGAAAGSFLGKVGEAFSVLSTGARTVVLFVAAKLTGIVDFIKALPGRIAGAAVGMWDGLKAGFVAVLNWIIGKWNWLADHAKAPSWVPVIGGKRIVPRIGEISDTPTAPVAGDRNTGGARPGTDAGMGGLGGFAQAAAQRLLPGVDGAMETILQNNLTITLDGYVVGQRTDRRRLDLKGRE